MYLFDSYIYRGTPCMYIDKYHRESIYRVAIQRKLMFQSDKLPATVTEIVTLKGGVAN